jgi:hypothetical protein
MQVNTAIELVNSLVYFPRWKFTATDHTARFEGTILVRIDYPAYNTDRENARQNYDEEIMTYATFPIIATTCDDVEHLLRKVMNALAKIYQHEAREALRVLPTYWAPFHPHNIDGMRRWRTSDHVCDEDIITDLQFGIG